MNTTTEIVLIVICVLTIGLGLFIIDLLVKKLRIFAEIEGKIKISFSIWISILFIALSIITAKTISVLSEAVNLISKMTNENYFLAIFQTSSIFVGLNLCWLLLWYFISKDLLKMLIGKREIYHEMELDHITYFLFRGAIILGLILSFMPIYESILRLFLPSMNIPFYQ